MAVESVFSERDDSVSYRSLPHNIEAEQALLGAMLVNNEVANRVSAFLRPEHFFQPVHGRIHEAILALVERGQIATPVTLKTYFEGDEALVDVGGAQYLARPHAWHRRLDAPAICQCGDARRGAGSVGARLARSHVNRHSHKGTSKNDPFGMKLGV